MHPVDLLSAALPCDQRELPNEQWLHDQCCVTGSWTTVVHRRHLFGKSFTDGALLMAPQSDFVGLDAYVALKYKWERMSSWICDENNFQRLDRAGVRNALFTEPPSRPWCGYATTSYKKHGALRAKINGSGQRVWLFETRLVDCSDMESVTNWWETLNNALRHGLGRSIILTLECPSFVIKKIGLGRWMSFEQWARPKMHSALYAFLVYLLPSQEELKNERQTISDQ